MKRLFIGTSAPVMWLQSLSFEGMDCIRVTFQGGNSDRNESKFEWNDPAFV